LSLETCGTTDLTLGPGRPHGRGKAMQETFDVVVIGGGFFGCMIARSLRRDHARVLILERGGRLLGRASRNNQARVHNGYHYPRSVLTAYRSRVNFPRFVSEFADCVDSDFENYYAVARKFSKVTARQFRTFFERIGAPLGPAPERVRRMFEPRMIEEVFAVREFAFDADKLATRMARALGELGVEVRTCWEVVTLERTPPAGIRLVCHTAEGPRAVVAGQVYNCTYSGINRVLRSSRLPVIPLKHELAEMALLKVPEALRGLGITVMCGPFFSIMPFPPRGLHTLSHVRYTPHEAWHEGDEPGRDPYDVLDRSPRRSHFPYMLRDALRYMPALAGCAQVDSLWEVKTVLPTSEADDSRPILLRAHHGMPDLHCVMGAKIDNIYDALDEIERIPSARRAG
jgi:glycine/D-amino acid oxidase-like deaminating enzyme